MRKVAATALLAVVLGVAAWAGGEFPTGKSPISVVAGRPTIATPMATNAAPLAFTSARPRATPWPAEPPARICGNADFLSGPATPPRGAIVVPAGNNAEAFNRGRNETYWLAPGVHTLNDGIYSQIQPERGTTFIGAPGAILDGRNKNLYAFTGKEQNVTIQYLTIVNFGTGLDNNNEGVVNHDAGTGWRILNNTVENNDGAGVFVGSGNIVSNNCLRRNGQYGFSAYSPKGVFNVVIDHNEIAGNSTDDWERRIDGCGCTGGAKFWDTHGAVVTNNWIHDNKSVGLWADTNNVDFRIEGNYIDGNDAEGLFYEISYNAAIRYNTFKRNNLVKGKQFAKRRDNFPVAAVYLSESGGDSRVSPNFAKLEVAFNNFEDNWGGVTLWENADRFCNSPANTSSGYCTLVPGIAKATCVAGTIANKPYYADCRWKTRQVKVHHNWFRIDKAAIGCTNDYCARNAVLSNYGTYPDWSPYQGFVVSDAITFRQGNVFRNNHYSGDWKFMPHDTGQTIGWETWRAAPYGQDAGSTID